MDMAETSVEPVLVSHTACRAVDRDMHRGGTSRTTASRPSPTRAASWPSARIPSLVGGDRIAAAVEHIRHAVDLVGADHVGVSSDRALFLQDLPPDVLERARPDGLKAFEEAGRYPGFWKWRRFKEAWEICARPTALQPCAWPYNVTLPLVIAGYSDEQIRKIIGENVVRVAGDILTGPAGADVVG